MDRLPNTSGLDALNRRRFFWLLGATGISAGASLELLAACGIGAPSAGTSGAVTVPAGTFAGVNNQVIKDAALPAFQKKYPKATIELAIRAAAEEYPKLQASPGRPNEAVGMWNDTFSALGSSAGLFEKFDDSLVPNRKYIPKSVEPANGLGIAAAIQPYGIAYNPKYVEKPTSWLDLFNPKYVGKVAMHSNFWDQYVMLAYTLGTDEHHLDVAINEWAKHKQNIGVWTTSFTQLQELVDKGEMWLGPQWGGFTTAAQRQGLHIAFSWPKEGCTQQSIIVHVNKGFSSDVHAMAENFANEWLTPATALAFLTQAGLSPANSQVAVPAEFTQYEGIITADRLKQNKLLKYDYGYVGSHLTAITQLITEKLT